MLNVYTLRLDLVSISIPMGTLLSWILCIYLLFYLLGYVPWLDLEFFIWRLPYYFFIWYLCYPGIGIIPGDPISALVVEMISMVWGDFFLPTCSLCY